MFCFRLLCMCFRIRVAQSFGSSFSSCFILTIKTTPQKKKKKRIYCAYPQLAFGCLLDAPKETAVLVFWLCGIAVHQKSPGARASGEASRELKLQEHRRERECTPDVVGDLSDLKHIVHKRRKYPS